MKILIYARGGGWGHLTRAAALARALLPRRAVILTNSPYCENVRAAMPELSIEAVSTREAAVVQVLDFAADVLVVDTFPRGLGGELAALPCSSKRVLVHRDINPSYVEWGNLRAFVESNFDLVLCPGEEGPLADLPQARTTAPWLVREPVAVDDPPDVVVCAGGTQDELPWYGEVCALLAGRGAKFRCLAARLPDRCPPAAWIARWPAIDWIASARVAIGGAGYNTVQECVATGTPLMARAWGRKYDRQRERAERNRGVRVVESPAEAVERAMGESARAAPPEWRNGALEGAALL